MAGNWFTSPFSPLTSAFGSSTPTNKRRKTETEPVAGCETDITHKERLPITTEENEAMAKKKGKNNTGNLAGNGLAKSNEAAKAHNELAGNPVAGNDDDEWYDTATTSEDGDPTEESVVPGYLTKVELLKYMPPLLSTNLPPCNAPVQVAYELVVTSLRERWLQSGGHARLTDLCEQHLRDILKVNRRTGRSIYKQRMPWSRDLVFKYQQCWAEYFLREAEAQGLQLMTESELLSKLPVVPPELGFKKVPDYVVELWKRWNEGKRMSAPKVPGVEGKEHEGEVGQVGGKNGWHREGNEEESTVDDDEVEEMEEEIETRLHEQTFGGGMSPENDAHIWSEGGHD